MTNQYVLDQVNEKRKLLNSILERKKRLLGHILRGASFVKEVIEGLIEGKRGRGIPLIMMLHETVLMTLLYYSFGELISPDLKFQILFNLIY